MAHSKVMSISEATKLIKNGQTVAIGGGEAVRKHPMAIVREMIRQGKRDLHLLGWNNGVDFDILIGADCTSVVETAYVGMYGAGQAYNFRRAIE
jgi:glutaconate CoA-transferase subunit A